MADQAKIAIDESDLVLLVVDAREGMNPFDQNICDYVRRSKKQFWVLVNKFDSSKQEGSENEFYAMGIEQEQIMTLSAAHGLGFEDLRDRLKQTIVKEEESKRNMTLQNGVAPVSEVVANVAIIGAPNAGKSTLLNRLLGANRALVSDIPGTTVDPIEGYFELYFGDDVTALKSYHN
jgi:GTP-binding protein